MDVKKNKTWKRLELRCCNPRCRKEQVFSGFYEKTDGIKFGYDESKGMSCRVC